MDSSDGVAVALKKAPCFVDKEQRPFSLWPPTHLARGFEHLRPESRPERGGSAFFVDVSKRLHRTLGAVTPHARFPNLERHAQGRGFAALDERADQEVYLGHGAWESTT